MLLATTRRVVCWGFYPPGRLLRPSRPVASSRRRCISRLETVMWYLFRLLVRSNVATFIVFPGRDVHTDLTLALPSSIAARTTTAVIHACGMGSPFASSYHLIGGNFDVTSLAVACPGCPIHLPSGGDLQELAEPWWPVFSVALAKLVEKAVGLFHFHAEEGLPPGFQAPWSNAVCRSKNWRVLDRWHWKRSGHINVLEAGAERRLVRHLCKRRQTGRINVLEDSRVTILSGAKDRSSARALRGQMCLSVPYQIGGNLYLGRHWCPSKLMPADYPSRDRDLPPETADTPSWLGPDGKVEDLMPWLQVPAGRKAFVDWARVLLMLIQKSERCWFVGSALGRAYRCNTDGDGPPRRANSSKRTAELPALPGHRNLAPATLARRENSWMISLSG